MHPPLNADADRNRLKHGVQHSKLIEVDRYARKMSDVLSKITIAKTTIFMYNYSNESVRRANAPAG